MKKNKNLWNALSAILIFLAAGFFFFVVSRVPQLVLESLEYGSGPEIQVQIPPGRNAFQVAKDFADTGIVDNPQALARWFSYFEIDRKIRPGTYKLKKGSPWEVAKQMLEAEPKTASITIVPGETWQNLPEVLSITHEELKLLLEDINIFPERLRPFLPDKEEDRLAFLLPETYQVVPGQSSAAQVIRSASKAWWNKIGFEAVEYDGVKNASDMLEVATVASLVEKETAIEEERPVIAGVIMNRLKLGMPLQIDATVVYAWSLRGEKITRVLHSHLEIDSPYNTYKVSGLPPGPICIPSKESWLAALNPNETPYLFHVADKGGRHLFSRTYQEHLKAIRKVRNQTDSKSSNQPVDSE